MSFVFNGGRGNGNNQSQQQDESWKAQGFLNFYLPTKGGGKRKLGTIALREGKANEKALIDWLKANPEANVAHLMAKLEVNFQTSEANEASSFDLGEAPKTGTNG